MLSSKTLNEIVSEARPIIERQLDDAERIAGFRDVVASSGGDWSALKALIKAQIQDERDESGGGKRVKKILEKAGFSTGYAELLGWSNMNEKNFSDDDDYDRETGEILDRDARRRRRTTEAMDDHKALVDEMADAGLISEEARLENKALADAVATKFGNGPAMALRSDNGLNIQTKHEDIRTTPVTAEEDEPEAAAEVAGDYLREPVAAEQGQIIREGDAPRETDRLGGDASCPDTEFQMDRATEGSFETGSEAAEKGREAIPAGPEGADLNHAGAGESPATDQPLAGGDHEVASIAERERETVTSNTGEGAANTALPADGVKLEYVPPFPMKRLPYAHCFPELSKAEYERLEKDIAANRVREPIIRQSDVIVDGWARYNISRAYGMSYPVQEYSGTDVLLDLIEWQRAARNFTPAQERKIAAELAKEIPHRAGDIFAAFGLAEALEAAE